MLFLLGIIICLIFIIMCISNSLKERKKEATCGRKEKPGRAVHSNTTKQHYFKWKKKEVGENDLQFLATILSAGLVDADPTSLQHLKEYRDLRGGST
ncbi:hypothetical protein MATL_G00136430 [Megalops atlanticus]|uniref:Uncharacterized protein n=1 Tax=Megalops atlanticus TaxID=7932 RepID=A0A9D3Q186_MEGAT|nr:hypothetical protein MATL_G00136430 [Megalops atlanticus]